MTVEINGNDDNSILRVFVVRHGQTPQNVSKIIQGHLDSELNEVGRLQADKVGKALASIEVDALVSSDLKRCVQTADYIKLHHDVDVRYTPNFREREMGPAEGMLLTDAIEKFGPDFRNLGETSDKLVKRIESEWNSVVKANSNSKNVVICTHGGVITGFTNYLYSGKLFDLANALSPSDLKVPFNTSIAVIDIIKGTDKGIIQIFGNTNHLGGHYEVELQNLL